jgi:hypothetical protein
MPQGRVRAVAMAMALAGGLAACGHSSSSSSGATSKADFCRTFNQLGSDTTPHHAAEELSRVGTPSDISAAARHGFEVLVDHLRDLPAGAHAGQITQMVQGLNGHDASDVRDFITYYAQECQGVSGGSS